MEEKFKVGIIGAGPAGLAMAARLKLAEIAFDVFEQNASLASSWRAHYDRLHLHTVKKHSNLPHLPFPKDYPRFVSKNQFIEYLEEYARKFELEIQFNTIVKRVERDGDKWKVTTNLGTHRYEQVVVASGVNRVPFRPSIPKMDGFLGSIIHSREYKNPKPFSGKKVLIVGMGNTGAEIALDLSLNGIETTISVRSPVNIVPLVFAGRATQETALLLEKLPKILARKVASLAQRLAIGDLSKFGLLQSDYAPNEQLSKTGKTPVIDLGTAKAIREGKIKIAPGIKELSRNTVKFTDGKEIPIDQIILCTGYKSKLEDFIPGISASLNEQGQPKSCIGQAEWNGMYFLGFNLFKAGGILGVIQTESEQILERIERP